MATLLNIISIVATFVALVGAISMAVDYVLKKLVTTINFKNQKTFLHNNNLRMVIILIIVAVLVLLNVTFYKPY